MTPAASFDASEVRVLSADLRSAPTRAVLAARPVIFKGATKIKEQMRSEMAASTYFKGAAGAIDFDLDAAGLTAEIGPKVGPGQRGGLGGIAYGTAYFGGSRGGGTVPDPQGALDAEAPNVEKALADLMEGML